MESDNRVYGKKVIIDTASTEAFYDQRARTIEDREEEYTTVLLGDQNPEYAKKWDEFEKQLILPKLSVDKGKKVVDFGCGIGRWAVAIAPCCGMYYGIDFSKEMISVARKKVSGENCVFINRSFLDSFRENEIENNRFDIVIITGVSMYINDEDLKECYNNLNNILNKDALIYIEESVGLNERLTLNHIWSDNLGAYYEAIYRTKQEYLDLLNECIENCEVVESDLMEVLDKKEQSETSHWYAVLHYLGE